MSDENLEENGFSEADEDIPENISAHSTVSYSIEEKNPLDELTDQQLIDLIGDMEVEKRHLELENMIFIDFLKNNDPQGTEGLEELFQYAFGISEHANFAMFALDVPTAVSICPGMSSRRSTKLDSYTSISSLIEGKGPKINLSQRNDMVLKATEEIQTKLENHIKKSHRLKRNLKAELDEFSIRESDITEARNIFEFNIVTQAVDPLTQRIPAEKFVKYMEDWLKSATLEIEKLRLRTASLKSQFKKVSAVLIQRQELRENVHAVDFDQLEIENKHLLEKIEQKQLHLIELKKMNGGANLVLSKHKKFLQSQQEAYNKLKESVSEQETEIDVLEKEFDETEKEVSKAVEKYEYYKDMRSTYRVPDVMEYVNLKNELYELKKNMKVLQRRKKIQDIALNACIREMKNITGSSKVDPYWFKDAGSECGDFDDSSSLFDDKNDLVDE